MGSEMCIRDSIYILYAQHAPKSCKEPQGTTRTAVVSTDNNNNTKCKNQKNCGEGGFYNVGVEVDEINSIIT